ncbi:MAG: PTS sugar transporter subunit IIC [Clostridia bacterium]|nr:PTS sugar transporter subunit IIC [Clostridia bacterium]
MTILQAALIGILYFLADSPWPFGGMGNYAILYRPVVAGLVVGIILGNPVEGTIIGATINLIYIGMISAGGSKPSDPALAGILGTALAISGHIGANAALALAVPIGLLGTLVWVGGMTLNSAFLPLADKYTREGKTDKIWIPNVLLPQLLLFAMTAIPCFFAAYFGANYISGLIALLGGKFLDIMNIIGGMLPAVGIGLTLLFIFKGEAKIFFFIGFLIAAYSGIGMLPLGLIGICAVIIYMQLKGNHENKGDAINEQSTVAKR